MQSRNVFVPSVKTYQLMNSKTEKTLLLLNNAFTYSSCDNRYRELVRLKSTVLGLGDNECGKGSIGVNKPDWMGRWQTCTFSDKYEKRRKHYQKLK